MHEQIEYSGITTVVATKEQVFSELGDEVVILNLKSGTYHGLNKIAARIWHIIQEPKKIDDILGILLKEYEVQVESCERDLFDLLRDLKAAGLIEVHDGKAE